MALFKAATFNANSIRTRMPHILAWLAHEQPDVLCVQETKVQDADFPATPLMEAGYHVIYRGQKSYAGVAIISKQPPEEVRAGFDDGEDAPRLLCATYQGVRIVNTYVPQGREPDSEHFVYKLAWFGRLREYFERHFRRDELLLWTGDFNVAPADIDIYDPVGLREHVDFHPDAKAALERMREWGFVDVFRKHHPDEPKQYTYFDYRAFDPINRGTGWRIDHIWTTEALAARSIRSWIDLEPRKAEKPSDHTILAAEFDLA